MKEFEPSEKFVDMVMEKVRVYENTGRSKKLLSERVLGSRLFRYAMSGGGIFVGIFLSPIVCV